MYLTMTLVYKAKGQQFKGLRNLKLITGVYYGDLNDDSNKVYSHKLKGRVKKVKCHKLKLEDN